MTSEPGFGIAAQKSAHSVDETRKRFEEILNARNIKLFGVVDHSGEAEQAGLRMLNTKLLIFGAPRAGTPIMLSAPSSAIDLPLKVLIFEERDGSVWVYYNSTSYLQNRHGFPEELAHNIAGVKNLVEAAAGAGDLPS